MLVDLSRIRIIVYDPQRPRSTQNLINYEIITFSEVSQWI
jgi:hypothetical protein